MYKKPKEKEMLLLLTPNIMAGVVTVFNVRKRPKLRHSTVLPFKPVGGVFVARYQRLSMLTIHTVHLSSFTLYSVHCVGGNNCLSPTNKKSALVALAADFLLLFVIVFTLYLFP